MITIAHELENILPHAGPALIPPQHLEPIRLATGRFPAALTRSYGFECRLRSDKSATDFTFCITQAERSQLARGEALFPAVPPDRSSLLWQRFFRFIHSWTDPSSPLYKRVLSLLFEFDIESAAGPEGCPYLVPGFFFGSKEFPDARSSRWLISLHWLYRTALPLLAGSPLPAAVTAHLRRLSAALPAGAHIFQMGVFYAREEPHLLACLTGIPPGGIAPFLRQVGYSHDLSGLEPVIAGLAPLCNIHFNLDLGAVIGPRVGLELTQDRRQIRALAEKDARLLDWLGRNGLCDSAQQAALLDYPGISETPFSAGDASGRTVLVRDHSHIKIVYQPGRPLEAKAYLQVTRVGMDERTRAANELAYAAYRQTGRRILHLAPEPA